MINWENEVGKLYEGSSDIQFRIVYYNKEFGFFACVRTNDDRPFVMQQQHLLEDPYKIVAEEVNRIPLYKSKEGFIASCYEDDFEVGTYTHVIISYTDGTIKVVEKDD